MKDLLLAGACRCQCSRRRARRGRLCSERRVRVRCPPLHGGKRVNALHTNHESDAYVEMGGGWPCGRLLPLATHRVMNADRRALPGRIGGATLLVPVAKEGKPGRGSARAGAGPPWRLEDALQPETLGAPREGLLDVLRLVGVAVSAGDLKRVVCRELVVAGDLLRRRAAADLAGEPVGIRGDLV